MSSLQEFVVSVFGPTDFQTWPISISRFMKFRLTLHATRHLSGAVRASRCTPHAT